MLAAVLGVPDHALGPGHLDLAAAALGKARRRQVRGKTEGARPERPCPPEKAIMEIRLAARGLSASAAGQAPNTRRKIVSTCLV